MKVSYNKLFERGPRTINSNLKLVLLEYFVIVFWGGAGQTGGWKETEETPTIEFIQFSKIVSLNFPCLSFILLVLSFLASTNVRYWLCDVEIQRISDAVIFRKAMKDKLFWKDFLYWFYCYLLGFFSNALMLWINFQNSLYFSSDLDHRLTDSFVWFQ